MPFTRYILSALLCCVLGVISGLSSAPVLVGPRTTYQIQVHQELGHRLSSEAEIYFSHDPEFSNYTARWNKGTAPDIAVVVVPASKEDVTKIVSSDVYQYSGILLLSPFLDQVRERHQRTVLRLKSRSWHADFPARGRKRHSDQYAQVLLHRNCRGWELCPYGGRCLYRSSHQDARCGRQGDEYALISYQAEPTEGNRPAS